MTEKKTYFILSREIFESAIWLDNPHVLKLFVYLVGNARYQKKPKKYPLFEVNRGEFLTSLRDLAEANEYIEGGRVQRWSPAKVSRMIKVLEDQEYIKILADTFGTHISICNYELYQNPKRYLANTSETAPNRSETRLKRECNASENNSNKGKKGNKDKNIIPSWIPKEAWDGFIEMRKKIKTIMTDRAVKLAISELKKLKEEGEDIEKVLDQSTMKNYKGLFPVKNNQDDKKKTLAEKAAML